MNTRWQIESDISYLKGEKSRLESQISYLEDEIAYLQSQLDSIRWDIYNKENELLWADDDY